MSSLWETAIYDDYVGSRGLNWSCSWAHFSCLVVKSLTFRPWSPWLRNWRGASCPLHLEIRKTSLCSCLCLGSCSFEERFDLLKLRFDMGVRFRLSLSISRTFHLKLFELPLEIGNWTYNRRGCWWNCSGPRVDGWTNWECDTKQEMTWNLH